MPPIRLSDSELDAVMAAARPLAVGAPTHGYEATREAAMAAFAKSWRRES